MSIFQVLSTFFALFMIYTASIHARKKTLNKLESRLWYSVWILFIVVAVFPGLVNGITHTLNFSRVFDLLVVIAFMILSIVTFNNYYSVRKLQKLLEQIVRSKAIEATSTTNSKK